MSNQSGRQESARAITGTLLNYEGDLMALFAADGITETTYNGALLAWINFKLGETYTNLPGAMAALAQAGGVYNWDSLSGFDVVSLPSFFTSSWTPDFSVYGSGVGGYGTSYDPTNDKPSGTTIWVDNTGGNDTTGDGTEGLPYKTIAKAVTEGAAVVNIKSGNYWRDDAWVAEFNPSSDIAFVAADGPGTVKIGRGVEGLSWASVGSNTYSTTRASVRFVLDLDEAGHATKFLKDGVTPVPVVMEKLADLAAVQASSGHAWAQVGSTLYVKTHDLRAPDADVIPFLIERNTRVVDKDITLYFEGLEIWGDRPVYHQFTTDLDNDAAFIGVDCGFRFSGENDNVFCDNIARVRLIRCSASNNLVSEDGFNHEHSQQVNTPDYTFLEVDCESFENGDNTNDNGSTSHDPRTYGIRLNGFYNDNPGPGVTDTEGAWGLNYGLTANNNYIGIQSGTFSGVNPAICVFKDCEADSNSNIDVDRSTGGQLISLGGNTYTTFNDTIVDGTNDFWMTLATTAPDAIVGIFSVDEDQYWDNAGSLINQLNDASPKKYNLLTPAGDYTYAADIYGRPAIDFGTIKHSKYFEGGSSIDLKQVYFFGQYLDGVDATFEDFNCVVGGPDANGQPRVIGSIGTADLHSGTFASTVSKNGGVASSTMLPAPKGFYKFTASSVLNKTWSFFGTNAFTNRGWVGYVSLFILTNRDLSPAEELNIMTACQNYYGT